MGVCFQNGGKDDCYKDVAALFSTQFGLKETLNLFATNEDAPEIYTRCHEATHYLSRNEYQKVKNVPQVYASCDSTCHGGCYHGVLEAYLKDKQLPLESPQLKLEFSTVCGQLTDYNKPLLYFECLHGLGHAAMFISDMELSQSLVFCDVLPDEARRERCYSGVFMENSSSSTNTDHPGKYVRVTDPLYPCNTLEKKYLEQCYRYQSSYFALITNHDWRQVATQCLTVPIPYQESCFRTVGTNQVGFTRDMKHMKANCYLMPDKFQETCIAGVIGSFAYRFVGDIGKMTEFCSSVNSTHQPNCFRQVGTSLVDWTTNSNERQGYCQGLNDAQRVAWCIQGLTV
jgi:hypothetical protein